MKELKNIIDDPDKFTISLQKVLEQIDTYKKWYVDTKTYLQNLPVDNSDDIESITCYSNQYYVNVECALKLIIDNDTITPVIQCVIGGVEMYLHYTK